MSIRIAKDRGRITDSEERLYIPKVEKLGKLAKDIDENHEHAQHHKKIQSTGFSRNQK